MIKNIELKKQREIDDILYFQTILAKNFELLKKFDKNNELNLSICKNVKNRNFVSEVPLKKSLKILNKTKEITKKERKDIFNQIRLIVYDIGSNFTFNFKKHFKKVEIKNPNENCEKKIKFSTDTIKNNQKKYNKINFSNDKITNYYKTPEINKKFEEIETKTENNLNILFEDLVMKKEENLSENKTKDIFNIKESYKISEYENFNNINIPEITSNLEINDNIFLLNKKAENENKTISSYYHIEETPKTEINKNSENKEENIKIDLMITDRNNYLDIKEESLYINIINEHEENKIISDNEFPEDSNIESKSSNIPFKADIIIPIEETYQEDFSGNSEKYQNSNILNDNFIESNNINENLIQIIEKKKYNNIFMLHTMNSNIEQQNAIKNCIIDERINSNFKNEINKDFYQEKENKKINSVNDNLENETDMDTNKFSKDFLTTIKNKKIKIESKDEFSLNKNSNLDTDKKDLNKNNGIIYNLISCKNNSFHSSKLTYLSFNQTLNPKIFPWYYIKSKNLNPFEIFNLYRKTVKDEELFYKIILKIPYLKNKNIVNIDSNKFKTGKRKKLKANLNFFKNKKINDNFLSTQKTEIINNLNISMENNTEEDNTKYCYCKKSTAECNDEMIGIIKKFYIFRL